MTEPCQSDTMPRGCAEQFNEIHARLAIVDSVANDVKLMRTALIGNGKPEGSIAFRLRVVESAHALADSALAKAGSRRWQIYMICLSAAIGAGVAVGIAAVT